MKAVFCGSSFETVVHCFNPAVQNVSKAEEHGSTHVADGELVDEFLKVDPHAFGVRAYFNIPFAIDGEVVAAPSVDVVQLCRVFNLPFTHCGHLQKKK